MEPEIIMMSYVLSFIGEDWEKVHRQSQVGEEEERTLA